MPLRRPLSFRFPPWFAWPAASLRNSVDARERGDGLDPATYLLGFVKLANQLNMLSEHLLCPAFFHRLNLRHPCQLEWTATHPNLLCRFTPPLRFGFFEERMTLLGLGLVICHLLGRLP